MSTLVANHYRQFFALQELALDLNNLVSVPLRLSIVLFFSKLQLLVLRVAVGEGEFRQQFVSARSIHLLTDNTLSEVTEVSKAASEVLLKLFNSMRTNVYIPGKTAHVIKLRTKVMQYGLLLSLIQKLINSNDLFLKDSIKNACEIRDLEWHVEAIEKALRRSLGRASLFERALPELPQGIARHRHDITQREKVMIKTYTWIKGCRDTGLPENYLEQRSAEENFVLSEYFGLEA